MKKVLCIVQARMGSTRLPGKVLKELHGYPMIYHTLVSLQKSRYIDQIVLATSDKDIDTPLAEYVESLGIDVFRGSEENVLERYKQAADAHEGNIIVRVTGDCPLINPVITDNVITKYLMYDYDYVRLDVPNTFQRGFDTEVFSKETLDKVYEIVCSEENIENKDFDCYREHVTYYIYRNKEKFNISIVTGEGEYLKSKDINLSVDQVEDFNRVKNRGDRNG
ncbi:MAG: cytidylyltransferase domain-containing protein [Sarcina sp.]